MKSGEQHWGIYTLRITCADIVGLLNAFNNEGIDLNNVVYIGALDVQISIHKRDYQSLVCVAGKYGATVKTVHIRGLHRFGEILLNRPVIVGFFVILLLMAMFLPTRILFITVDGNSTVPTKLIIEAAEQCGIRFGVSRRQIRSEVLKNALLQQIPQLQWAGINTAGCTAKISVQEKTQPEDTTSDGNQVCSIIASRDGIIQNSIVYQGNALCTVGQAVKAGQTLVSGYIDLGLTTKATRADAEIIALTFRKVTTVTPHPSTVHGDVRTEKTKYSLRIGKKLIKFYKDSGNLDSSCGKIYSEEYVHLPGGFRFPIALIKEKIIAYELSEDISTATEETDWIKDFAKSHLQESMIAGEIVSSELQMDRTEDAVYFFGNYACLEMIGQVKYEQTILRNETND